MRVARFCGPKGRVWNLVQRADGPETRKLVEHEAGHCPPGGYRVGSSNGEAIEPKFEPSLSLIQDTARQVSGPIWIRGGIPVVSVDGEAYEVRKR
jgi:hypothetical protein